MGAERRLRCVGAVQGAATVEGEGEGEGEGRRSSMPTAAASLTAHTI
jgi:hypothetical protein